MWLRVKICFLDFENSFCGEKNAFFSDQESTKLEKQNKNLRTRVDELEKQNSEQNQK